MVDALGPALWLLAISSTDFWSFITELVSRNPTRGIPALEDGSLANLLILYYFWVFWVFESGTTTFETAKTSFSRNDLEIKIFFDFGTFSYNLRNTRLTTIIDIEAGTTSFSRNDLEIIFFLISERSPTTCETLDSLQLSLSKLGQHFFPEMTRNSKYFWFRNVLLQPSKHSTHYNYRLSKLWQLSTCAP